ncbi:hypothetical protein F2981_00510 [Sinorhizobium meliloti]|nr:hypothetical protein [Sinorhizobium meliloti]
MASRAKRRRADQGLARQGDFLVRLGLLERAAALAGTRTTRPRKASATNVERLAGSGAGRMGSCSRCWW